MKKALVLVLIFCIVFFFSCGDTKDNNDTTKDKDEKVEISFMIGGSAQEKPIIEEVVQLFEKANPNIDVKLVLGSIDTEQRKQSIVTALRGKQKNPDIFLMDVAWVGQLASSGYLADLTALKVDTSAFYSNLIEKSCKHKGKVVSLPSYLDGGLLYYRTDLLKEYGFNAPPKTWAELAEIAQKVQEGERAKGNSEFWGFVWQGKQYEGLVCDALEYFVSANGGFLDQNNKPMLNSDANKKALQFMTDTIHKYKISPPNTYTDMAEEEVRRMFQFGNAMFERNWPYAYGGHTNDEDSKVKGKFDMAPLPAFEGGKSASTLGGWQIGMSNFSDQKEASKKFMEFYTSYDSQKYFALKTGWNPTRVDVYDDKELAEKLPHLKRLKTVFEGAVPRPQVPYYTQLSEVMQKYFNSALAQSMNVSDALEKANKELEDIIKSYE